MSKVRIVTDSTADIPLSVREELEIGMVPLKVHFGNEAFLDAIDITPDAFADKLVGSSTMPTTSQPSPAQFLDMYNQLGEEPGTHIVSIHLSSSLSGTYQSAMLAKSMYEGSAEITVIDSRSASYGIGSLVIAAAHAAREGRSVEEIEKLVASIRNDTRIYFLVDTLQYLQKGGRIGKASALVGSLLNIKPILSIDDEGQVFSVDKVRGSKKAMSRIVQMYKEEFGAHKVHVTVAHCKAEESAEEMLQLLKAELQVEEVTYTMVGPVIAAHAGPGLIGVFVHRTAAYV